MQYLEQPILNCLLLLLTGLKSYFCFVSEGLGDWSKLFCSFKRWACFAFLHPLFPVVFHFCAISWRGAASSFVQTVCVLLAWACTMVPGPVLGNIEPVLHQGSVVPGHALYSCSEERCKMLNGVLGSTCPLEHLVLQLCSDSHQGHSFFFKLWVASPVAPWL